MLFRVKNACLVNMAQIRFNLVFWSVMQSICFYSIAVYMRKPLRNPCHHLGRVVNLVIHKHKPD